MGNSWSVIGWQFGFACRNGDGRLSAEPSRKYSKYNQCANRTYGTHRSFLSVACVQIERIVPQGMQCVTPSIDACLIRYKTTAKVQYLTPPSRATGRKDGGMGEEIAEVRRYCHPPMRLDHRHTHTAVNIPLPVAPGAGGCGSHLQKAHG